MKRFLRTKKLLWVLVFLLGHWPGWAADPTISASNVQFPTNQIDGGRFTVSFTAGNGTGGRIVVVKEGSDITGLPVDGTKYNVNAAFKTAGTEFTAPGEYVVAHVTGSSISVTVTNLKPGTTYYVAIFELNGSYSTPATIDYSPLTPTDKKVTTLSAPGTQAAVTGFTQVTGNSAKVNWTNGNGTGRIIVAKKGNSLTATPEDLKLYSGLAAFGTGTSKLDAETYVVFKNTQSYITSADVTNLEPNTTYTFAAFEFNGDNTPVYASNIITQSLTTSAGPTQQASRISFSGIDGNKFIVSWTRGNGSKRLVIAKKGSEVTTVPVNGNRYAASAQFGTGAELVSGSEEFVVYNGTSSLVTLTNLEKFTTYHVAVYEFDEDANGNTYYLTSTPPTGSQSTALPPTGQTTMTVSNITGSSAQITLQSPSTGRSDYRMLVIREGAPVEFEPEDLKLYSGATDTYKNGPLVGPDTYILYGQSNGGGPNLKGLTPGHTYHLTVFDMNGRDAPVYKRPGSHVTITVPNEPLTASKDPKFITVEGNFMRFDWTNGDGARRIVVARKGSPVTSLPVDGTIYTSASKFGTLASELVPGSGEFVVYNDAYSSVTITGLEIGTVYHLAVFEYNLNGSSPDYLTTAGKYLITSGATVSAPTIQISGLSATDIQSDRATLNFTTGNGASRIFVMREDTPVDAEPADLMSYAASSGVFGGVSNQMGAGNYVVGKGHTTGFTVTGLKPGTSYYVTAFEYNGGSAPAYLRPGAATYQFTTAGGVVITAPTQAPHTPVFEKVDGNKFTLKWTSGNGENRLVVARKGSAVSFAPADGTSYAANAAFGSNTDQGGGQYVVFNGNGSAVEITNLEPNSIYYFSVFEYNGAAGSIKYGTTALSADRSTAAPPTTKSSGAVSVMGSNALTLSWTRGNGEGRLVVAKEGSEVTAQPSVLSKYAANSVFKNGPQLAMGEYVVYAGSGSSVTITGLEANKTYYFSVFEYNGTDAPVYNTTDVLKASAILSSPLPVSWLYVTAKEKNGMVTLEWATAQEINTDYFQVQRSTDGVHYAGVANLPASGNSATSRSYSYTDAAGSGTFFYRIKQVDRDGKISYSKNLKITTTDPRKVQILQNPVQDRLQLRCSAEYLGGALTVTDAAGRVWYTAPIASAMPVVHTHHLKSGVYYVSVRDKNGRMTLTLPFVRQ